MAKYVVQLQDAQGFEITSDEYYSLEKAKTRARYFLSNEYAKQAGTTHAAMQTHKAAVNLADTGECVWDKVL